VRPCKGKGGLRNRTEERGGLAPSETAATALYLGEALLPRGLRCCAFRIREAGKEGILLNWEGIQDATSTRKSWLPNLGGGRGDDSARLLTFSRNTEKRRARYQKKTILFQREVLTLRGSPKVLR